MKVRFKKDWKNENGRIISKDKIGTFANDFAEKKLIATGFAEPIHGNILTTDEVLLRSLDDDNQEEEGKKVIKKGNKIVKR